MFVHGLQRFKSLRYEEDFGISLDESKVSPATRFNQLICDGTRIGFHLICTCDTANNAVRFLSRKALSEFDSRVVFQMSANDSASLIETPKASTLGLHRAILQNTQAGTLETFRPYSLPDYPWIDEAARHLSRLSA